MTTPKSPETPVLALPPELLAYIEKLAAPAVIPLALRELLNRAGQPAAPAAAADTKSLPPYLEILRSLLEKIQEDAKVHDDLVQTRMERFAEDLDRVPAQLRTGLGERCSRHHWLFTTLQRGIDRRLRKVVELVNGEAVGALESVLRHLSDDINALESAWLHLEEELGEDNFSDDAVARLLMHSNDSTYFLRMAVIGDMESLCGEAILILHQYGKPPAAARETSPAASSNVAA